jgi:tetratricopeptide (TPR) repeat protein
MLARLSRAHMRLLEEDQAIARADEALAIAEPRRLTRIIAEAFINKAASLGGKGRLREPVVLMEAAVKLAHEAGDVAQELRARNNLGAVLANEDGAAAIRVAREAYELSTRLGISQMSQWLIGAISLGAVYEGLDWDAALRDLDAELEQTRSDADRARLLAIREYFMLFRGDDTADVAAERSRLARSMSDPDADFWERFYPAMSALLSGQADRAIELFRATAAVQSQNQTDARLGLILAAHFTGDLDVAREGMARMDEELYSGNYVEGIRLLAEAGIAALEGRTEAAVPRFRAAVEKFEQGGSRLHAAITRLDALTLLPGEPSIAGWVDAARERFEVIKSPPLLALLDRALAARSPSAGGDDRLAPMPAESSELGRS